MNWFYFVCMFVCVFVTTSALPAPSSTTQYNNTDVKHSDTTIGQEPTSTPRDEEETGPGVDDVPDIMTSYRPCHVSDLVFQHREQIPREDPCEICVCVDSEMYCLWKNCPQKVLATTKEPAAATTSTNINQTTPDNKNTTEAVDVKQNEVDTNEDVKFSKILTDKRKLNAIKEQTQRLANLDQIIETMSTNTTTQTTVVTTTGPTVCLVMGIEYQIGEVLPRDTGTCLECSCTSGARVKCRPKDCSSQSDNDYLAHNNLDMFDLDTF